MFHLFGKVYLDLHHRVNPAQERMVLSATTGFRVMPELEKVHPGKLLHADVDFLNVYPSTLVEKLENIKSMNRKVVIYCDDTAYKQFVAMWYGAIFPDMPYRQFKDLFHTEVVRNIIRAEYHDGNNPNPTPFVLTEAEMTSLHERFVQRTNAGMKSFIRSIWSDLSFEYQVFDFLKTGSNGNLKRLVPLFTNRFFAEIVQEYRRFLLYSTYSKQHQTDNNYTNGCVEFHADPLAKMRNFRVITKPELRGQKSLAQLSLSDFNILRDELRSMSEDMAGFKPSYIDLLFSCWDLMRRTPETITSDEISLFLITLTRSKLGNINIPSEDLENINLITILYFMGLPMGTIVDMPLNRPVE